MTAHTRVPARDALGELVILTARRSGYPRIHVELPGRMSDLPIAPTPDAWARTVAYFQRSPAVLFAMFAALAAEESDLRAGLKVEDGESA